MQGIFEKIKERFETDYSQDVGNLKMISIDKAIEIVNEVAKEYGKETNFTTDGFIFTKEDVQKIIDSKKRRLDDLEHCWNEFTRHMECGEIRELKESCIDDEIMIHILSEWLLKDVPEINVGEIEEFCEWGFAGDFGEWHACCKPLRVYIPYGVHSFEFCPYCGKKIKVVE